MSLSEGQQKLLDAICAKGGGVGIHEAMNITGLTYPEIERTARELIAKGYQIRALSVGGNYNHHDSRFRGWINRLFLSPYDLKYDQLIKN